MWPGREQEKTTTTRGAEPMPTDPKPCASHVRVRRAANGYLVDEHDPSYGPAHADEVHVFQSFDALAGHLAKRFGEAPERAESAPGGFVPLAGHVDSRAYDAELVERAKRRPG